MGDDRKDPRLVAALCDLIPCGISILDFGAGIYVRALREAGRQIQGIDGIAGICEMTGGLVWECDLTERHQYWIPTQWTICIEVGEHIHGHRLNDFLDNLAESATEGIVISWAIPGQRGRNHISCRPPEWVVDQLWRRGWLLDWPATEKAREIAGGGWHKKLLVLVPQPK